MKTICVLQHIESEYLGLIEDHLEARSIRFGYCRPFVAGGKVPASADGYDGLVVLGAGPFGAVSGSLLPTLAPELRLTADFLHRDLPVIGIGLGSVILATAAGGGAVEAPLRFAVDDVHRVNAGALGDHLPERFPMALYMRDRPELAGGSDCAGRGAGRRADGLSDRFQSDRFPRAPRHQVGYDRGHGHGIRRDSGRSSLRVYSACANGRGRLPRRFPK